MPKAKYWVFTLFSEEAPVLSEDASYITFQQEQCPETGRAHYQGYIELKRSGSVTAAQTAIGWKCHVEPSRSEAAIAYCHKEETRIAGPWEFGSRGSGGRGSRSDIDELIGAVRSGKTREEIAELYPATYIRFHGGVDKYISLQAKPRNRNEPPHIDIRIGNSGTGKTRGVYDNESNGRIYRKDATEWWHGYNGQETILFDDWVGSSAISPSELLQICDWYPLQVQTKGGYVQLTSKHIIFTTTEHWGLWYQGTRHREMWEKKCIDFQRRIDDFGTVTQLQDTS